jgi:hypothetical protein
MRVKICSISGGELITREMDLQAISLKSNLFIVKMLRFVENHMVFDQKQVKNQLISYF